MTSFTTTDFRKRETTRHHPKPEGGHHGGGDKGLIRSFVQAVKEGKKEILGEGSIVDHALLAHLVVFAAERSRRESRVINIAEFERELRGKMRVDSLMN